MIHRSSMCPGSMRHAARPMASVAGVALAMLSLCGYGAVAAAQAARAARPPVGQAAASSASSASAGTQGLARQLRAGGFVLVMRHAQSPDKAPTASEADAGNVHLERQLDAAGKASARELGQALHELGIPIGRIYASPTYRAMQTVQLAGLGNPEAVARLSEGARGMRGRADRARILWLQDAVRRIPAAGTNTLIVTHTPNIVGAFGSRVADIAAGEMLVFRPHGAHAHLVGRITVAQWQRLATH